MNAHKTQTPGNTNDGAGRLNKLSDREGYLHRGNLKPYIPQENHSVLARAPKTDNARNRSILAIRLAIIAVLVGVTSFLWTREYRRATTLPEDVPVQSGNQF